MTGGRGGSLLATIAEAGVEGAPVDKWNVANYLKPF